MICGVSNRDRPSGAMKWDTKLKCNSGENEIYIAVSTEEGDVPQMGKETRRKTDFEAQEFKL
jgi:hypothetical protein